MHVKVLCSPGRCAKLLIAGPGYETVETKRPLRPATLLKLLTSLPSLCPPPPPSPLPRPGHGEKEMKKRSTDTPRAGEKERFISLPPRETSNPIDVQIGRRLNKLPSKGLAGLNVPLLLAASASPLTAPCIPVAAPPLLPLSLLFDPLSSSSLPHTWPTIVLHPE